VDEIKRRFIASFGAGIVDLTRRDRVKVTSKITCNSENHLYSAKVTPKLVCIAENHLYRANVTPKLVCNAENHLYSAKVTPSLACNAENHLYSAKVTPALACNAECVKMSGAAGIVDLTRRHYHKILDVRSATE
jgi:hypothetical protein